MSSVVPTFWELLQNFFSWFARLFCEKERKPDCEEQIGLPTRVIPDKEISSDATLSTPKDRRSIQGRPPRRPEWARQNVFRQLSSKRRAVYDDRPHRKRRPAPGSPLIQLDSTHRYSKPLSHRIHVAPTIRVEDWSILPPSRKSLSQRLSFIMTPTRPLRPSGLVPDPRKDFLAVPTTDSSGHLFFSSSSRMGRYKYIDPKESEQVDVSISKLALPSDLCGSITNELWNLDATQAKAVDNKPRHSRSAGGLFTRTLHVTFRNTMPALKRVSRISRFYSLPAAGFSSLFYTNGITERDLDASSELEFDQRSEAIVDNPVVEVDSHVLNDSTSPVMTGAKAGSPITTAEITHDSQSLLGLGAPTKLPHADFGDVPYPFVFDLDIYLSEADVPATPFLLVSFPGFGSEFSSPATDYFDTPTPSPKLPVTPLLLQQIGLSDTPGITCETTDFPGTSGDLERSMRESLDASGMTLSLHSSVIEDVASSQSEYSILSVGYVDDSLISSDFGKPTVDDLDKSIFDEVDDISHESNTSTVIEAVPSEPNNAGESGSVCLPEKVTIDVYATSDEDGAGMTNQTSASLEYASCPSTGKSCETGNEEGESVGHKTKESQTIDQSTFFNRHRRLLENLSFSVSNKKQRSLKKDSPDSLTLLEASNVASFIAYPTTPGVSSDNIAYSQSPRVARSPFHLVSRERPVTGQRKIYHRATTPTEPLTPMLIPTTGIGEIMRRGIRASKGGFGRERPGYNRAGQKLGGVVGPCGAADLPQVARRRVMPERF